MLEYELIDVRETWDRALLALPHTHALQSWDWGDFKSHWGWRAHRLMWREHDVPVAAAQILRRAIPHTPWNFLYVSKGPVWDYADPALTAKLLADLEHYARQSRALFIKIDPDVPCLYGETQTNESSTPEGKQMFDLLVQRGWRFSPEQIQFRNTMVVDLTPDPETMLSAMKSKWRYNIRLAERKGVEIRRGTVADIPAFYQMYAETATRDGFLIRPEAYYAEVWARFIEANQAVLLLAEVSGTPVAGLIMFLWGESAWYMYGASTGQQRRLMPNHLLQWAAMLAAKERGCSRYDMWGAPDVFDETDRMWGVYRFKQGFGGQVMQGLGAFDYPVSPVLYWLFTAALPRLRTFRRRLKP